MLKIKLIYYFRHNKIVKVENLMDSFLVLFIIVLLYVLFLIIIRYLELGSKESCIKCNNCCPDCSAALNRIKRLYKDKVLHHITLRIFQFKRYTCHNCGWEGLKWEKKYKPGRSAK